MDFQDLISLAISAISVVTAVAAIFIARLTFKQQLGMQSWMTNHNLLLQSHDMISKNPKLLSLFGIDIDEARKDGISDDELIFINVSMDASSAFYRIANEKQIVLTPYRKSFLRNEKVRVAWKKYLREKRFNTSAWHSAVDSYIAEIEANPVKG